MDLDEAADELYAVSPEDFGARRDALVAAARSAGDRDLAKRIAKLRKPVLAAALINAVTRSDPAELTTLTELGMSMRTAQRELRGADLRELSGQRQQLLTRLVRLATAAAGRSLTEAVLTQVRGTFEAAIADEGAEAAVLSGRLTTALSYTGFGEVDVTDAVGAARTRPRHLSVVREPVKADRAAQADRAAEADRAEADRAAKADQAEADRAAEQAAAQQRLAALQQAADAVAAAHAARVKADQAAGSARDVLDQAIERTAAATARVDELADLLRLAHTALDDAAAAQRSAEAESDTAVQAAQQAADAESAAKNELSELAQRD